MVAEPLRAAYPDEDAYAEAQVLAAQDRKLLAIDVVKMLLPPSLDAMPSTSLVLSDAVAPDARVTGRRRCGTSSSTWTAHKDTHGHVVANYLRDMAELPLSRLFFPTRRRGTRSDSAPP